MQIITLHGNIGRDAEVYQTQSGQSVCNFNLAVNDRGKDGEDVTTWYRCAVWGNRGERLKQYLVKGTRATVVGRLQLGVYTGNDGQPRVDANVTVDEIDFTRPRDEQGAQAQAQPAQTYGQAQTYGTSYDRMAAEQPAQQYGAQAAYEDDSIPF